MSDDSFGAMTARQLLVPIVALLAFGRTAATATVVVPVSMETLAIGSPLVVLGRVEDVSAVADRAGRISTLVRVDVQQVLKGQLDGPSITLKEEGGAVGGVREVVYGTPVYRAGEEVLLFLSTRRDGSLRTAQMALGKFLVTFDRTGMPQVERAAPADMEVLGGGALPVDTRPLSDVLAVLDTTDTGSASGSGAAFIEPQPLEATDPSLLRESTAPFQLNGERFFEPDEGVGLGFLIDSTGDSLLGPDAARQAVDAGFSAWTDVPSATITLTDDGLTNDLSTPCPGPNKVLFNDPDGSIPPPSGCTGMLAVGGNCSYGSETKRFAGRTFDRALRARVVFADGWDECAVWNELNFAEIAAHEIGHAIGLGHSSDPDATMYFLAHFDGRGASLRTDDVNAVSTLYPTALPLTITTPNPLPDGLVGAPYDVELTVAHASGAVSWTLVKTKDPGLTVTGDGHITGSPTFLGSLYVQVKATDAEDSSHTKLLQLTVPGVAPTPTPSSSPTRTATGTETATPTPTGSVTPSATSTAPPPATSSPTATPTASATATASSEPTSTTTPTVAPTASATTVATVNATASATNAPSVTASPTASASTPGPCAGGCTAADPVTVHDLVRLLAVALGDGSAEHCPFGDTDGDTRITVADTVAAVELVVGDCSPAAALD